MAIATIPYPLSTQMSSPLDCEIIIPDEEYKSLYNNRDSLCIMINSDESKYNLVNKNICSFADRADKGLVVLSKQTYMDEFSDMIKMIKVIGCTLIIILLLIGILNFINAVSTGIIARKRELAMMYAVGMTGKQIKSMLIWEGIYYSASTAVFSVIMQTILDFLIIRNIIAGMNSLNFNFVLIPTFVIIPVLLLLSAVIPLIPYRYICKQSVVNRLKEL